MKFLGLVTWCPGFKLTCQIVASGSLENLQRPLKYFITIYALMQTFLAWMAFSLIS